MQKTKDTAMTHHRYALRDQTEKFHSIYSNYRFYRNSCVCKPNKEVFALTLEETTESEHELIGWKDHRTQKLSPIFRNRALLSVYFPYGLEAAIAANQGQIVYLKITSVESCGTAGELERNRAAWDTDAKTIAQERKIR